MRFVMFSVFCLGFVLAGCEQLGIRFPTVGGPAGSYGGPECDEVRQTTEEAKANNGGSLKQDATTREYALAAVCPATEFGNMEYGREVSVTRYHKIQPFNLEKAHLAFDDREYDDVQAALFVMNAPDVDMLGKQNYGGRPHRAGKAENKHEEDEGYGDEMIFGLATMYAAGIDMGELSKELAALKLPADAQQAFVAQYTEAKRQVAERVAAFNDGKKKIFVDLPMAILSSRRDYYAKNKEQYARLDELEAKAKAARSGGGGDATAVAAGLTKIRSDYVVACGTDECTFDPLYVEVTRELALLYVGTRQPMLARAESWLLTRKEGNKTGFAQRIYAEQEKASLAAREAWEVKNKSQDKGMDAKLTGAVLQGVTPLRFNYGTFWHPPMALPDYADVIASKTVKSEAGYVAGVRKKGDKLVIDFKTEFDTVEEPVNCARTGRISRIQSDGTLEYEEVCQYHSKQVARDKPGPVTLDASEAGKMQPGELIVFLVDGDTRNGVVLEARKGKETTQIRADRVKGKAPEKPKKS